PGPGPRPGGRGSAVWPCHGGCAHEGSEPGWSSGASGSQAGGSPGTVRPRLGSRPEPRSGCTLARSAPFYRRVRIVDLDLAVLAPPLRQPGVAPRSVALPAQIGLVQHAPDGVRADLEEPVL